MTLVPMVFMRNPRIMEERGIRYIPGEGFLAPREFIGLDYNPFTGCIKDPLFYVHHPCERIRSIIYEKKFGCGITKDLPKVSLLQTRRAKDNEKDTNDIFAELKATTRNLYGSEPFSHYSELYREFLD